MRFLNLAAAVAVGAGAVLSVGVLVEPSPAQADHGCSLFGLPPLRHPDWLPCAPGAIDTGPWGQPPPQAQGNDAGLPPGWRPWDANEEPTSVPPPDSVHTKHCKNGSWGPPDNLCPAKCPANGHWMPVEQINDPNWCLLDPSLQRN